MAVTPVMTWMITIWEWIIIFMEETLSTFLTPLLFIATHQMECFILRIGNRVRWEAEASIPTLLLVGVVEDGIVLHWITTPNIIIILK